MAQVMGPGSQHIALLPASETPKPWETVVAATYAKLKNIPVLFCRTGLEGKGRWIAPGQAVVVDEEEEGKEREEDAERAKCLCKVRTFVGT